ncbi:hypothetical protein AAFF_G00141860 [Aldrovandia affinis]|uniref:Uncharacterized protein n=1 Tax=Aldrovandia affinis TaxID=143900 RepID=A0AAD7TD60_9TELE|nr:hypothetical protein AAFF_G00141860 [Aldrovandia affinis]
MNRVDLPELRVPIQASLHLRPLVQHGRLPPSPGHSPASGFPPRNSRTWIWLAPAPVIGRFISAPPPQGNPPLSRSEARGSAYNAPLTHPIPLLDLCLHLAGVLLFLSPHLRLPDSSLPQVRSRAKRFGFPPRCSLIHLLSACAFTSRGTIAGRAAPGRRDLHPRPLRLGKETRL